MIENKITEYLTGRANYDVRVLLREARAEIESLRESARRGFEAEFYSAVPQDDWH